MGKKKRNAVVAWLVAVLAATVVCVEAWRDCGPGPDSADRGAPVFAGDERDPADGSLLLVVRVVDGDTVVLSWAAGEVVVRVIGIDTPETVHPSKGVEPWGPEASARARVLLNVPSVVVEYDADPEHDRRGTYGRLLAYLRLPDGRDFGRVMIEEGLARSYAKYPFSRSGVYAAAERRARLSGAGMWGR